MRACPSVSSRRNGTMGCDDKSMDTASTENPYEPRGCRECGQPVEVVRVTFQRSGAEGGKFERRCHNPSCATNERPPRMGIRP